MKQFYILIALVGCLIPNMSGATLTYKRYDSGVSLQLAEQRKRTIKDLKYELSFAIPEKKSQLIDGEITIRFTLDKADEVVLDFREKKSSLKSVACNGKQVEYLFANEHLVIPKNSISKGENAIHICFVAGNQSLNRNDEFLYTLLVPDRARTVFPCFDQPNLKAAFTLNLEVPNAWKAVSNTYQTAEKSLGSNRKVISFAPTEPLSTYLFSFVAGKLEHREYKEGERKISAFYRETDPKKIAQLDVIFKQVMASLKWLEEYTGIAYPFAKYDFIILPGFQYGGMEHTGATLYNDNQMFLSEHPTPDEELRRTQLIAHETAHMWFGDLVTMNWFNDVWTKEVFANYFAAAITEPQFPEINHTLNRLRTFNASALSEDRTLGSTPIRQPLDNLSNAGLIYSQIVYNKAPITMAKLVEIMGKENFRKGIQEYLRTYAYSNATWDDLVKILNSHSKEDLKSFSNVWVNQKGMPKIEFQRTGGQLIVNQSDVYKRGLIWSQRFNITLCGERDSTIEINLNKSKVVIQLPHDITHIIPNTDGRGYGLMIPDAKSLSWLVNHWQEVKDETTRQALLMLLYENYLAKNISDKEFLTVLYKGAIQEKNALIASSIANLFASPLRKLSATNRDKAEVELLELATNHPITSFRTQLTRTLIGIHRSKPLQEAFYAMWKSQSNKQLNDQDYTTLAYELALRMPQQCSEILSCQRARITNSDRLRQFDFIARGITANKAEQKELFQSLLKAENRRIEPWTATLLSYLNDPLRESYAVEYILPGLEALKDVQRTGDIFFPRSWVSALLGNHHSKAAYQKVDHFLQSHPNYSPLLKSKILQAAYPLYREYGGKK